METFFSIHHISIQSNEKHRISTKIIQCSFMCKFIIVSNIANMRFKPWKQNKWKTIAECMQLIRKEENGSDASSIFSLVVTPPRWCRLKKIIKFDMNTVEVFYNKFSDKFIAFMIWFWFLFAHISHFAWIRNKIESCNLCV